MPGSVIAPLGVLRVPASVPGEPGVVGRVMAMMVPLGAVPVASPKLPTRRSPPNEPKPAGAIGHSPRALEIGPRGVGVDPLDEVAGGVELVDVATAGGYDPRGWA